MIAEDCEFAGLLNMDGQTLVGFLAPANNNKQGVWLAPDALRQLLTQNPGHTELARAFYALEKNALHKDVP